MAFCKDSLDYRSLRRGAALNNRKAGDAASSVLNCIFLWWRGLARTEKYSLRGAAGSKCWQSIAWRVTALEGYAIEANGGAPTSLGDARKIHQTTLQAATFERSDSPRNGLPTFRSGGSAK